MNKHINTVLEVRIERFGEITLKNPQTFELLSN